MSILTDYIVISSDPFELETDQQRALTFELPGGLLMRNSLARPLLAYKVQPLASPAAHPSAVLTIDINNHRIVSLTLEQAILCGLWEAFPGQFLQEGATNIVQFRLLRGQVRLADVVLWFQRTV
jgi:hypothetical protein